MELNLDPTRDKALLRRQLKAERMSMKDRHLRAEQLQEVLQVWLVGRSEVAIGAYWPIGLPHGRRRLWHPQAQGHAAV